MWTVRLTNALGSEREVDCSDSEFINYVAKRKVKADTLVSHPKYTGGEWANACNLVVWKRVKEKAEAINAAANEEKTASKEARRLNRVEANRKKNADQVEPPNPIPPAPNPVHQPPTSTQVEQPYIQQPYIQQPYNQQPYIQQPYVATNTQISGYPVAPGKVQAIAIMQLVTGILMTIAAAVVALGTLFLYLPWIYSLVVGILAIVRGTKLMGRGAYGAGNSKALPIMMIINMINCDVIALTIGILCLVFQSDPRVASYLEGRASTRF